MCIMASSVVDVSGTKIFVGSHGDQQITVYSMNVELQTLRNAMILPVPIVGHSVDEIQLVDLSEVPDFFKPLQQLFEVRSRSFSKGIVSAAPLEIFDVGNFKVSIAPTLSDLERVDRSVFELSSATQSLLRHTYKEGYAFIVAQLNVDGEYHPLAYIHPLIDKIMFVPTRHEHGHRREGINADWDHEIFFDGTLKQAHLPAFSRVVFHSSKNTMTEIQNKFPTESRATLSAFLSMQQISRLKVSGSAPNMDLRVSV